MIKMSKFEQIGTNLQLEAATKDDANRNFRYSCNVCCTRGIRLNCDTCRIKTNHEMVVSIFDDYEQKIMSQIG